MHIHYTPVTRKFNAKATQTQIHEQQKNWQPQKCDRVNAMSNVTKGQISDVRKILTQKSEERKKKKN